MTKMYEAMFIGFVQGKCDSILATYRDSLPTEVFDAIREMRDTASQIATKYYEKEDPKKRKAS